MKIQATTQWNNSILLWILIKRQTSPWLIDTNSPHLHVNNIWIFVCCCVPPNTCGQVAETWCQKVCVRSGVLNMTLSHTLDSWYLTVFQWVMDHKCLCIGLPWWPWWCLWCFTYSDEIVPHWFDDLCCCHGHKWGKGP